MYVNVVLSMSHCFAAITTISVKLSLFCKIKTIWFVETGFASVTLAVLDLSHAGIKGGTTTTRITLYYFKQNISYPLRPLENSITLFQ